MRMGSPRRMGRVREKPKPTATARLRQRLRPKPTVTGKLRGWLRLRERPRRWGRRWPTQMPMGRGKHWGRPTRKGCGWPRQTLRGWPRPTGSGTGSRKLRG